MRVFACVLVLLCLAPAWAKEPTSYPEGDSSQAYDGVPFRLRVPPAPKAGERRGLVLLLPGTLRDLDALADHQYVVVAPSIPEDRTSGLWSAGEVKVILKMIAHLSKVLGVDRAHVHAACLNKTSLHDIFEMVVFRKKAPFASATYVKSTMLRTSIPGDAKKRMGVLGFDWEPSAQDGEGVTKLYERLDGKVRVAERRYSTDPLGEEYFRYWLHVMGGGFTPGHDLSLPWLTELKSSAEIQEALKTRGTGGLLYVYSATADAESALGRSIQNDVLFDRHVREAARAIPCIKQDSTACPGVLTKYEITTTPVLLVLDAAGGVKARYDKKVKAKALAKALRKAAKGK